jgi:hypothetical protein
VGISRSYFTFFGLFDTQFFDCRKAEMGKFYVTQMKKVAESGHEYITGQVERLTKIISGSSVKPEKLTEFQKKLNILKMFDEAHSKHVTHGQKDEL